MLVLLTPGANLVNLTNKSCGMCNVWKSSY